jgi:hypothetical protein
LARQEERDYSHRSRIDKLGVKPGMRVSVEGELGDLLPELTERGAELVAGNVDIAFLGVQSAAELGCVPETWARVCERGAMWIVYPKGVQAVTQMDVIAAGRALGLLDVKVISFSGTHTGLRFVAPRASSRR